MLAVTALMALAAGFVWAYKKVGWFRAGVQAVWGWIKKNWPLLLAVLTGPIGLAALFIIRNWDKIKAGASSVWTWIKKGFNSLMSWLGGLPGRIGGLGSRMWQGIKDGFKAAINWIIRGWNSLQFGVPNLDLGPLGKVGGGTVGVPQIPYLAKGGSVKGKGAKWISGESGPELGEVVSDGVRITPLGLQSSASLAASRSVPQAPSQGVVPELVSGEDRPLEVHAHLYVDGREMAANVGRQVADKKARR
jgi:hypothetical protein